MAKKPEVRAQLEAIAARVGVTVPWDSITINRWRPDTCERPPCTVEQWFDDRSRTRTVLWAATLDKCSAHSTAARDEALWNTVRGENIRKNKTIDSARGLVDIADDVEITWEFDSATRVTDGQQRLLTVTVPETDEAERTQIQAAADIRFGPGVIIVERG